MAAAGDASYRMSALAGMSAANPVTLRPPVWQWPDDVNSLHGTQFTDLVEADFDFAPRNHHA
jgi:hypothetical protein